MEIFKEMHIICNAEEKKKGKIKKITNEWTLHIKSSRKGKVGMGYGKITMEAPSMFFQKYIISIHSRTISNVWKLLQHSCIF